MPNQRQRNAIPPSNRSALPNHCRFAIKLAFDGTTYKGFQSQPHNNTIQDQLEYKLRGLMRRHVGVLAWGRTDSGVHATGAVVTVDLTLEEVRQLAQRQRAIRTKQTIMSDQERAALFLHAVLKEFDCDVGLTANNADEFVIMPQTRFGSITAQSIIPVPSEFDARYSAQWKRYVYYIMCASGDGNKNATGERITPSSPFAWNRYAWHVKQSLDYEAMTEAAKLLGGREHNFEWLCIIQRGEMRDTRRTVKLRIEQVPIMNTDTEQLPYFLRQHEGINTLYKIECECDFFLYKMMRRIVGVLVSVGKHDASIESLNQCIDDYDRWAGNENAEAHDRGVMVTPTVPDKLLHTAPAKGLCLEHIEYGTEYTATIT
jgi:tRNA pseudouridine(38-40) synthase